MSQHSFHIFCQKPRRRAIVHAAASGYGLALLIAFLVSSILIGASISIILGPSASNYVGSASMDDATAKQLAEEALDAAQTDMLTQQAAGTAITTSYRYPSSGTNSISVPTYPSSGSSVAKGSYYVTTTYARGFTFILKANVTVGNNSVAISRLVQLDNPASVINSALAVYSLRQAKTTYSSYVAQVRCASTSTTTNIGFTASGDFDLTSLRSCLGDSTLPLDVTTGEKLAYGLRKLSSSYSGYAIKVRRSSDNATQDIGFDSNGNLDTQTLKSFVGSGSGYVATWYDQSGSGKDATQATTSRQPRIVNAGVVETKNNVPSIYFDDDSLSNTALGGTLITGAELRAFLVSSTESGGSEPDWGEFAVLWKSGDSDAWSTPYSMEILCMGGDTSSTATTVNGGGGWASGYTTGVLYQHTSYHDASNNDRLYRNGSLAGTDTVSANLAPTSVVIGTSAGSDASTYIRGYISEIIIFNSSVSAANRATIEKNQGHYYNVAGMTDGYVTTWYDQSGNGRNATQATTSKQPTIAQVGVMSASGVLRPAILFDGTDDYLTAGTSTAWPSSNAARTMNAIFQPSTSSIWYITMGWGSLSSGKLSNMMFDTNSYTLKLWGYNADLDSGTTPSVGQGHKCSIVFTGSSNNIYVDGVLKTTRSFSLSTTSNTELTIGAGNSGTGYFLGTEAEVLIYDSALNSSLVTELDTNQNSYYGL